MSLPTPERTRSLFRIVAIAEALSWGGLLIGMYFKWIPETTEKGVQIMGPIHGAMFIAYVLVTLLTANTFKWSKLTTLVALAASIPPFFTYLFEVQADKRGLLDPVAAGINVEGSAAAETHERHPG